MKLVRIYSSSNLAGREYLSDFAGVHAPQPARISMGESVCLTAIKNTCEQWGYTLRTAKCDVAMHLRYLLLKLLCIRALGQAPGRSAVAQSQRSGCISGCLVFRAECLVVARPMHLSNMIAGCLGRPSLNATSCLIFRVSHLYSL
jgi:hypothetical protein